MNTSKRAVDDVFVDDDPFLRQLSRSRDVSLIYAIFIVLLNVLDFVYNNQDTSFAGLCMYDVQHCRTMISYLVLRNFAAIVHIVYYVLFPAILDIFSKRSDEEDDVVMNKSTLRFISVLLWTATVFTITFSTSLFQRSPDAISEISDTYLAAHVALAIILINHTVLHLIEALLIILVDGILVWVFVFINDEVRKHGNVAHTVTTFMLINVVIAVCTFTRKSTEKFAIEASKALKKCMNTAMTIKLLRETSKLSISDDNNEDSVVVVRRMF